jgi:hypothetical protein
MGRHGALDFRVGGDRPTMLPAAGTGTGLALTVLILVRLRMLLDRLLGGRRPPTGPLTTAEETDAEELRQRTLVENERIEREREEQDRRGRGLSFTMNSSARSAPEVQSTRGRTSSSSSGSTGTKPERR